MKSNKPILIIPLILITIIVIIYNRNYYDSRKITGKIENAVPVRMAVAKAFLTASPLIAHKMGYFKEEGLKVQFLNKFGSGKTAFQAMLRGEADISTPATTPVVFSSFNRNDFSIFVTYTTTFSGVKIIARKDRGINLPYHLKGKRIGIIKGTISQLLINSFLAYNKILYNEITQVYLNAPQLPEALKKGKVDVISVWEPFANSALTGLKENGIVIPTSRVYRMAINLAVMNKFAEKNPDVLKKIIRALQRSEDLIKTSRKKSQEKLSEILGLNINFLDKIWDEYNHNITLDQLLLITMENEAEWFIKNKYIDKTKIPNYLNYIYFNALEDVNPGAVSIIRRKK